MGITTHSVVKHTLLRSQLTYNISFIFKHSTSTLPCDLQISTTPYELQISTEANPPQTVNMQAMLAS